jgi:small subunit ribosomal protein S19e
MKSYDIDPQELINRTAEKLKKLPELTPPEWAKFVKTGAHKERPPINNDWWYTRAASILRKIQKLGPIGTNKLRRKYGGKKNRGSKPEEFRKGSGKIIRTILQQLDKAGLTEHTEKGVHKGRILTKKGVSFLNKNG